MLLYKSLFFTSFPAYIKICFHSGPLSMIFVAITFYHSVNLKQLPMVLTPFLTFQLGKYENKIDLTEVFNLSPQD